MSWTLRWLHGTERKSRFSPFKFLPHANGRLDSGDILPIKYIYEIVEIKKVIRSMAAGPCKKVSLYIKVSILVVPYSFRLY